MTMKYSDERVEQMLALKCRGGRQLYARVLQAVGELDKPHVAAYWARINADGGLAESTIRTQHSVLKSCLRYLAEEEGDADAQAAWKFLRTVNLPANNVSVVKREPLTDEERDRIRATLPERMRIFMDLVRFSGLRVSAGLSLTKANIVRRRGGFFLSVRGKRGKLFEWPVPDVLAQRLLALSEPWFDFSRHAVYHALRRTAERQIQRRVSPHDLRRAFAGKIWDQTHDLLFLAKSLGHASPQTSMRYVLADESRTRKVLAAL